MYYYALSICMYTVKLVLGTETKSSVTLTWLGMGLNVFMFDWNSEVFTGTERTMSTSFHT